MLVLDILNDFRGEALPSRDKKKKKKKKIQSTGIKLFYSNTCYGFQYKKLHK